MCLKIGVKKTFKDNYLRYFDPRHAGQRKGLQLIFFKKHSFILDKIIHNLIWIARVMHFEIQNSM